MSTLSDLLKKTVGSAITEAVENTIAPAAEKLINKVTDQINASAESINAAAEELKTETKADAETKTGTSSLKDALSGFGAAVQNLCETAADTLLKDFPAWEYSKIHNLDVEVEEDYSLVTARMPATEENLRDYHRLLVENGFSDSDQIQRKTVDGREHCVDFSFAEPDPAGCELRFLIYK